MGNLLSTLQTTGSQYTYYDGNNPQINPLSTKDSDLHYDSKKYQGGYSTRGSDISNYPKFFQNYNAYDVGSNIPNYLPTPSNLEINDPIGADANNKPKYDSTSGQRYQDQKFK